ncbi:cadherin-5 [Ambystoma mexicanum]|uniref:cadherin-5 n=1 Tax=Ambystoma mexicanum TaxID=8296 RepID=UPI0037E8EC5E
MGTWILLLLLNLALYDTAVVSGENQVLLSGGSHPKRSKRAWLWNQMHVREGIIADEPYLIGKLKTNTSNPYARFILMGEYANTLFTVNSVTGDVFVTGELDREKKDKYEMKALLIDGRANVTLEEASAFVITVIDANDNAPVFVHKVFNASVPEMSAMRTSVTEVKAVDADDPTVRGHAQIEYQIIKGQENFYINDKGVIFTSVSNLDREKQSTYHLIVAAKDSPGLMGGLSGTASVIITVTDINDNYPIFKEKLFTFNVPENTRLSGEVGKLQVEDIDEPQNRKTKFSFVGGRFEDTFSIASNAITNQGILGLKKPLDFENIQQYRFNVEATDPTINIHGVPKMKSSTEVIINVLDVDEPPVFSKPYYHFEVKENLPNTVIGFVSAKDPDAANRNIRYLIRKSDTDHITVLPSGSIVSRKPLDREASAWQNLTIAAQELDSKNNPIEGKESLTRVYVKVLDENDNAPEFAEPYEARVCENAAPGTVIINISAIDPDETTPGTRFSYILASKDSNFTVQDNHDNTAKVIVKYGGLSREEAKFHHIFINISDGGNPAQTSINTLTIGVCTCDENGEFTFCEVAAKQVGVSVKALVAIFVCILTILVITLLLILRQRYRKDVNILGKNVAEIHEQLVTYDEEGGGEMDTTSYDVSVLNSVRRNVMTPRMEMAPGPCLYAKVKKPARNGDMGVMIEVKKDEADNDGDMLPYDTLHIFGYEGSESIVESLSSLESGSSDSDIDYDVLNDWGPRFKMLADLYGLDHNDLFEY